jgi:hypothetical protein
MIASNPFAELAALIPPSAMQAYVVVMVLLVVAGTILDMLHKQSAQYFFENARQARKNAKRTLSAGEKGAMALKTLGKEVLTSGEFNNPKRRISHLFIMYGFIIFVVTTAILIFAYPTQEDPPTLLPLLWHLGAAMLCLGGYWFWFSIRVDVASEGVRWYQLNGRGDLFIIGLLGMATFALLWSLTRGAGALNTLFFAMFVAFTTLLFGSVYWSKFAHMFFKPAAAFQKRVIKADGSRENMPAIYDPSDPEVQARFPDVLAYMGANPPNMGLGIKRETPNHF